MSDHQFGGLATLLDRLEHLAQDPDTAGEAATLSAAMLTILGSGPTIAAIDSMIAANQADGLMYHNAVANQQRANILAMVATARTVAAMFDPPH